MASPHAQLDATVVGEALRMIVTATVGDSGPQPQAEQAFGTGKVTPARDLSSESRYR